MAHAEVTGWLQHEIDEHRTEWYKDWEKETPFENHYCLAKIPNQPEDYSGPPRYCMNPRTLEVGHDEHRCKYHGGAGGDAGVRIDEKYHDAPTTMTHGMTATVEHLKEDFDEKDQKLYDWIVETYPDAYNLNLDENPSLEYDLHRLAAEVVRAERGRGYVLEEGEVKETEARDEDGLIVTDPETGEVVTNKSEHYLSEMLGRQDRKITKLEKELGITRKEQQRHDTESNAVEAMKGFQEVGKAIVSREDNDYDPDEKPWKSDDNSE